MDKSYEEKNYEEIYKRFAKNLIENSKGPVLKPSLIQKLKDWAPHYLTAEKENRLIDKLNLGPGKPGKIKFIESD